MIYSDKDIKYGYIEPFSEGQVQPASYDLRLGNTILYLNNDDNVMIDPRCTDELEYTKVTFDETYLHPGEFALSSTLEKVTMPDYLCARVEGKSSLGRLGLIVHSTAGFVDPGFAGTITLEMTNLTKLPIKLYAGMKIAQICFMEMKSVPDRLYGDHTLNSKYQFQKEPTPSKYHMNRC